MWPELTIVTTVTGGYGKYLRDWAESILEQSIQPARIVILTHGPDDQLLGSTTASLLTAKGFIAEAIHVSNRMDFGVARNTAVSHADTEWVMHFDCDDELYPYAVEEFQSLAPDADVISAGYTLSGNVSESSKRRLRLYKNGDGLATLDLPTLASGISPFRKSFWRQSPYRTDMVGAWDTALWIKFAQLGARFRATPRAAFKYRQHDDSIFNQRRRNNGWARARTTAQLKAVRRNYSGVAIIVPRDMRPSTDRETAYQRVRTHYEQHHSEWPIVTGVCPSPTWIKGAAINAAIAKTHAEILVVADADCIVAPDAFQRSVNAVMNGAPWSMPHHMVYRANRGYTDRVCGTSADILPVMPFEDACERRYEGALGGGIFVIRRQWYDAMGGIPIAFRGWGSEDRTFGVIANTLLGPCDRGTADLLHLWHAPQTHTESADNLRLAQRIGYAAMKGPDALMMTLTSLTHVAIPTITTEQRHQMLVTAPTHTPTPINRVGRPAAPSAALTPDLTRRRRIP